MNVIRRAARLTALLVPTLFAVVEMAPRLRLP